MVGDAQKDSRRKFLLGQSYLEDDNPTISNWLPNRKRIQLNIGQKKKLIVTSILLSVVGIL